MALSALTGALLAGFLGGAHCVAMCGGFVTALAAAPRPEVVRPLLPASQMLRRAIAYHFGRIFTYTMLGAMVGGVGGLALASASVLPLQRALYLVANGFMIALGVAMIARTFQWPMLERGGALIFGLVQPQFGRLALRGGPMARVGMGMLWGLVPCGLIYSVLPIALFAGGAVEGGAVMLAFGVGTLPNLLAAGFLVARAKRWFDARGLRIVAAALLFTFAAVGIVRALGDDGALARGPFCLSF
jgi:sulfite exporter TauE/SafE